MKTKIQIETVLLSTITALSLTLIAKARSPKPVTAVFAPPLPSTNHGVTHLAIPTGKLTNYVYIGPSNNQPPQVIITNPTGIEFFRLSYVDGQATIQESSTPDGPWHSITPPADSPAGLFWINIKSIYK